jgi:deoxyribodipyrimidine photo-lyase
MPSDLAPQRFPPQEFPPQEFPPTRAAALERLAAFALRAGTDYARDRNYDHGPDRRGNVSLLSPYVRRRIVTEAEVAGAALARHGAADCEKFVQEALWRTYWKGWLEMRPCVWDRYIRGRDEALERAERNGGLRRDVRAATEGRTGIEGFDDWARELVETGYLHNHARMWFASIWIFTLRLPWELGADFFLRHLADGDPASNTLSWRWVAGLQTRGKTYLATRDNIARCTGGRFSPAGLAATAVALEEPPPEPPRSLVPMAEAHSGDCALLLTEDDLGVETLHIDWSGVRAATVADLSTDLAREGRGEAAAAFGRGAAIDALARVRAAAPHAAVIDEPMVRLSASDILPWLQKLGQRTLLVAETPVGPAAEALARLAPALAREGVALERVRRGWDARAWPHATKGFFQFRERIPELLAAEGI